MFFFLGRVFTGIPVSPFARSGDATGFPITGSCSDLRGGGWGGVTSSSSSRLVEVEGEEAAAVTPAALTAVLTELVLAAGDVDGGEVTLWRRVAGGGGAVDAVTTGAEMGWLCALDVTVFADCGRVNAPCAGDAGDECCSGLKTGLGDGICECALCTSARNGLVEERAVGEYTNARPISEDWFGVV